MSNRMGVDTPSIKWLYTAKSLGADYERTAILGRQFFQTDGASLQKIFDVVGSHPPADDFVARCAGFAEAFYELLGAREVVSIDSSSYEGATFVHDMNVPIPAEFHGKFSVVHDGGTLEHVFNFPEAIRNVMKLLRVGGHFVQVTVANNFIGHGFYQFSPELIHRVFCGDNGFEVLAVALHEAVPAGKWYLASDPRQIGHRSELMSPHPTYLLTIARKTAEATPFTSWPQQSDYLAAWNGDIQIDPTGVAKVRQKSDGVTDDRTFSISKPGGAALCERVRNWLFPPRALPLKHDLLVLGQPRDLHRLPIIDETEMMHGRLG